MSEEKEYGIKAYMRFNPNTGIPVYREYVIYEWGCGSVYAELITPEPLTFEEAQALLKLLEERHE